MSATISHKKARAIASDWYGGQFTGLYALSSTGSLYLWTNRCHACGAVDTLREVRDCLMDAFTAGDKDDLRKLAAYVTAHGSRLAHDNCEWAD